MEYSELKLVSRISNATGIPTVFSSSADLEYDKDGNFVLCSSEQGLEQVLLKGAFTSLQFNGYGTLLATIIGTKSIKLLTALLISELVKCYNLIKKFQLEFLQQHPEMDKRQILSKLQYVQVAKASPTRLNVRLKVESLEDTLKGVPSNQPINFQI